MTHPDNPVDDEVEENNEAEEPMTEEELKEPEIADDDKVED